MNRIQRALKKYNKNYWRTSLQLAEEGFVIQTVIVKKTHPKASSLSGAKSIAKEVLDREPPTSRETEDSYRFRNKPPEDFVRLRTKEIADHVSIVGGPLKG
jgi:hypothetical protein